MALCRRIFAILSTSLLCALGCGAASSSGAAASVEISSDNGGTWHELAPAGSRSATTEIPLASKVDGVLSARTQDRSTSIPSSVVVNSRSGCKSVTLIRWVAEAGDAPFALGWKRSPTEAGRHCNEDSPLKVRTVETVVNTVKPRWSGYIRTFSVEDAQRAEQLAADGRGTSGKSGDSALMGLLIRWNKILLPLALFAIIALANGIYLGITAVEEEEAAELRAREERLLRRVTGQPEPRPRVTVAAPRPSKKKRKGKQ